MGLTLAEMNLKVSLAKAIDNWMQDATRESLWDEAFGEYVGYVTVEQMTDAAFAVLMAVKDVQVYLLRERINTPSAEQK